MAEASSLLPRPMMLYDGGCGLCARSLRFVLRREADATLHFAPLGSDTGRRVLREHGLPEDDHSSIVYVDARGRAFRRSTAVCRVAGHLAWPWRAAGWMRFVPVPLRDLAYRFVTAVRFRIAGREDASQTCSLLPPEQRHRVYV